MTWKKEIKKAQKVYVVAKLGPYYNPKDLKLAVFDDRKKAEEELEKVTSYNEDGSIDDGSAKRTQGEAYIYQTYMNNDFSELGPSPLTVRRPPNERRQEKK